MYNCIRVCAFVFMLVHIHSIQKCPRTVSLSFFDK